MKTKITVIIVFLTGFISNVIAQNSWKPDLSNKYYVPEITPQYLSRTETFFGADFEFPGEGAKITQVLPNSPAENYNFRRGDIITAIGSIVINSDINYRQAMETNKPDENVTVYYTRKGLQKQRKIKLDKITVYKLTGAKS